MTAKKPAKKSTKKPATQKNVAPPTPAVTEATSVAAPVEPVPITPAAVKAYKGFGLDMTCKGHLFVVGETYTVPKVKACEVGFHACERPTDVFDFYAPATSRYAEVEMSGEFDRHETKIAATTIRIVRELSHAELIAAQIEYTVSRSKPEGPTASGVSGAATASGYRGAATASGYRGAATASGDSGAATASGVSGAATASGVSGAATASGWSGRARGAIGCALFLVERANDMTIIGVIGVIVDGVTVKADAWYSLRGGKLVEV